MKANVSFTQTAAGNKLTLCIPESTENGRIDVEFLFRESEQADFLSLQKSAFNNQIGVIIQPKKTTK
jgi:hypothetical protein